MRLLLESIKGEDATREGLIETPRRVHKAFEEYLAGYSMSAEELLCKTSFDTGGYDQMIVQGPTVFYSLCEHHLAPFFGSAFVAYIPNGDGRVVGLSKLSRLVHIYAKRLQVQERMTDQIAQALAKHVSPNVAVYVEARHLCMCGRGVQSRESYTSTSSVGGAFSRGEPRAEFFNIVNRRRSTL